MRRAHATRTCLVQPRSFKNSSLSLNLATRLHEAREESRPATALMSNGLL